MVIPDVLKAHGEDWINVVSGMQDENNSGETEISVLKDKLHKILFDDATIMDINTVDLEENDLLGGNDYDKLLRNERLVSAIEELTTVKTGRSFDEKQVKEAEKLAEEIMKYKDEQEIFTLTKNQHMLRLALEDAKEVLTHRKRKRAEELAAKKRAPGKILTEGGIEKCYRKTAGLIIRIACGTETSSKEYTEALKEIVVGQIEAIADGSEAERSWTKEQRLIIVLISHLYIKNRGEKMRASSLQRGTIAAEDTENCFISLLTSRKINLKEKIYLDALFTPVQKQNASARGQRPGRGQENNFQFQQQQQQQNPREIRQGYRQRPSQQQYPETQQHRLPAFQQQQNPEFNQHEFQGPQQQHRRRSQQFQEEYYNEYQEESYAREGRYNPYRRC